MTPENTAIVAVQRSTIFVQAGGGAPKNTEAEVSLRKFVDVCVMDETLAAALMKWIMEVSNVGDSSAAGAIARALDGGIFTQAEIGTPGAINKIMKYYEDSGATGAKDDQGRLKLNPHLGQVLRYMRASLNWLVIKKYTHFDHRDTSGMVKDINFLKEVECMKFAVYMFSFLFTDKDKIKAILGDEKEYVYGKGKTEHVISLPENMVNPSTEQWFKVQWESEGALSRFEHPAQTGPYVMARGGRDRNIAPKPSTVTIAEVHDESVVGMEEGQASDQGNSEDEDVAPVIKTARSSRSGQPGLRR